MDDDKPSFQSYYSALPPLSNNDDISNPIFSSQSKVLNMMKKMGYEEGKGLGKDLQGVVSLDIHNHKTKAGLDYKAPEKLERTGLYKCNTCDKYFNHFTLIERHTKSKQHMNGYWTPKVFECIQCNIFFLDIPSLQIHDSQVEHNKVKPQSAKQFQCEICNVLLNSEKQWTQHLNGSQHKDMLMKTPMTDIQTQLDYVVSQYPSNIPQASTDSTLHPPIIAGNENDAQRKQFNNNNNNNNPPPASQVFSFPSLGALYSTQNYCTICQVSCNGEVQFESHLKSKAHQEKLKPAESYSCGTCSLTFNSSSQLNSHNNGKKHLENVSRLAGMSMGFQCTTCNVVFNSASQKGDHDAGKAHQTRVSSTSSTTSSSTSFSTSTSYDPLIYCPPPTHFPPPFGYY